jgi:hypothetical protein
LLISPAGVQWVKIVRALVWMLPLGSDSNTWGVEPAVCVCRWCNAIHPEFPA